MKKIYNAIYNTLVNRRNEILDTISSDSGVLNQMRQDQCGDVVDFASGSAFGEMSSQLAEVEMRELKNIEAAIKRIGDKTYGVCEGCQCAIKTDRLTAIPCTMHCINCQRVAEGADLDPGTITDWSLILGDPSSEFEKGSEHFGANLS